LARSNTLIARFLETSVPPNFSQALASYKDALGQLQQLEKYLDKSEHIETVGVGCVHYWLCFARISATSCSASLPKSTKVDESFLAIARKLSEIEADAPRRR
jgi:hypothetical protein